MHEQEIDSGEPGGTGEASIGRARATDGARRHPAGASGPMPVLTATRTGKDDGAGSRSGDAAAGGARVRTELREHRPVIRIRGKRCVTFIEDATGRRRAEDALRDSEARSRALSEYARDVMLIAGADGTLRYVSPSVERMLGYSAEALIDRRYTDFLHPDDLPRALRAIGELLANPGAPVSRVFRVRHRNGSWRVVDCIGRNLLDHPALRGLVVNLHDETERRRAEDELRQSQKLEAVGRLAGGVAHDFNNILTAIGGFANLILAEVDESSALRADLREITESVERAATLTRQLLAFSRRQVLQQRPCSLNDVIGGLGKMLRRLIGEDIELVTDLEARLPAVVIDPAQMEVVVINLAVNARDAMPHGGRLFLRTRQLPGAAASPGLPPAGPEGYVALTVADTGGGIAADVLPHIFEPFFTTKDASHGTGLGLATVFGIVEQSGGRVLVESEVGRGAAFTVYLPASPWPAVPDGDAATPEPDSGSEVILLTEDEAPVRQAVRRLLQNAGYTVIAASEGVEALRAARAEKGPIHLLISDVVMPHLCGSELARRVQEIHPETRVLFMSGYPDEQLSGYLGPSSRIALLHKPFSRDDLLRSVREVLGGAR